MERKRCAAEGGHGGERRASRRCRRYSHSARPSVSDQANSKQAERLCRRALAIFERRAGPEDTGTGLLLTTLANVRGNQGKFDGVEEMYRRSLAIPRNTHGPGHSKAGVAPNNLGNCLYTAGRYAEAIDVLRQAINLLHVARGPDDTTRESGRKGRRPRSERKGADRPGLTLVST